MIISFFRGRAPNRPDFASSKREVATSIDDCAEMQAQAGSSVPDYGCIGETVFIEYVDSRGASSERWVSISGFSESGSGQLMLLAYCFMRKQPRAFRLDRIKSVADSDGEIHEPAVFFDFGGLSFIAPEPKEPKPGSRHKSIARHGLKVLCALARIDGRLVEEEVDVIVGYAEEEAAAAGIQTDDEDIEALRAFIRRQQPIGDIVSESLTQIMKQGEDATKSLFWYAQRVMNADGVQHDNEVAMLLDLSVWLDVQRSLART